MHPHITFKDDTLFIENCSSLELAKKFKTPLYVISESTVREKFAEIKTHFIDKHPNTIAAYASKAFLNTAFAKLVDKEGFYMDVVSGGELYTAIKANFPAEKIIFHGNNKSLDELQMAIDHKVGRIVVDNTHELDIISKLSRDQEKTVNILFRITPEVKATTHDYISTGQKDSKFGISLDEGVIFPAIEKAINEDFINFLGFHFHVGSQLFENNAHIQATKVAMSLILEVKNRFNYEIVELNTGGGFGIKYTRENTPKRVDFFTDPIVKTIDEYCAENNLKRPLICIEPGRMIIGEAGTTLYTVGSVKEITGVRTYVAVDGGMTDNIRPALYQAKYEAAIANRLSNEFESKVTLCGKCCESGDILIENIHLAQPEAGDIVAVFSTGAYNYSMASHYNKCVIPGVVLVSGDNAHEIIKRETYEDLIRQDVIPEHLK